MIKNRNKISQLFDSFAHVKMLMHHVLSFATERTHYVLILKHFLDLRKYINLLLFGHFLMIKYFCFVNIILWKNKVRILLTVLMKYFISLIIGSILFSPKLLSMSKHSCTSVGNILDSFSIVFLRMNCSKRKSDGDCSLNSFLYNDFLSSNNRS